MCPQSATYSSDSWGNSCWISSSTVNPPIPESNTPIGASLTMVRPTHAATGVAFDAQLTETCGQGIDQQQASDQGLAETGEQFQRFKRLQAAHQTDQRADHAGFAAGQFGVAAVPV